MNSKLLIGFVVVMFACCAQAGIEKFGDLGTGSDGYYKHCFVMLSLENLMGGYLKQRVGDMLGSDRREVETQLNNRFGRYGRSKDCPRRCFSNKVDKVWERSLPGEKELDSSRCERYARFEHLCNLVKAKASSDPRLIAIQNWLCTTSKELERPLYSTFFKCQEIKGYPSVFKRGAEKYLESVLDYSMDQLEEVKRTEAAEIEASNKLREEFDAKLTGEAYSKVLKDIDRLPSYTICAKQQMNIIARERSNEEERRRAEESSESVSLGGRKHSGSSMSGLLALAALGASTL